MPLPLWQAVRCGCTPKIVVENGAMRATKKYRGKIDNVIMAYVKDMEADLKAARPERVFITHSGCSKW